MAILQNIVQAKREYAKTNGLDLEKVNKKIEEELNDINSSLKTNDPMDSTDA